MFSSGPAGVPECHSSVYQYCRFCWRCLCVRVKNTSLSWSYFVPEDSKTQRRLPEPENLLERPSYSCLRNSFTPTQKRRPLPLATGPRRLISTFLHHPHPLQKEGRSQKSESTLTSQFSSLSAPLVQRRLCP